MIFFGFSLGNFRRYSIAMAYVGYLGMGVNHPLVHFFFRVKREVGKEGGPWKWGDRCAAI